MDGLDAHPALPDHQYVTEFTWAYELHVAASATTLLRNRKIVTIAPEQHAARVSLLDINIALLIDARDKALDAFCASWIKYRASSSR